jgi:hypothetical protein
MKYICNDFDILKGSNCTFASLQNIFRYKGYNLSEADIFFLCDGLNVEYNADLDFISYRAVNDLRNLSLSAGITVSMTAVVDCADWKDKIVATLSSGEPVLLFVNTAKLDYHRVFRENENYYHAIILYGVDMEKDLAYIADPVILDGNGKIDEFQGAVSLEAIFQSVYRYAWFNFDAVKKIERLDVYRTAQSGISRFLKGTVVPEKSFFGMTALHEYLCDMKSLASMDDQLFVKNCMSVHHNVKVRCFMYIVEFITKFIQENANDFHEQSDSLLEQFINLKSEWGKVASRVLKIRVIMKKDLVHELVERCCSLLMEQEQLLLRLTASMRV